MTKITSLTAKTSAATTDVLPLVDLDATATTKKITFANIIKSLWTQTKGNIGVSNGTTITPLAVGSNNQVLTADSEEATGMKWATPDTGGESVDMVYPLNTTIGDYAAPASATATSSATVDSLLHTTVGSEAQTDDIYSGYRTRQGNQVLTSHALIGKLLQKVGLKLKKTGSPTGTATIAIRNNAGTIQLTLGTLDVSTLTTSYVVYTFENLTGHTLVADDRVDIEFTGGDASNKVQIASQTASGDANIEGCFYNGSYTDFGEERYMEFYVQSAATASLAINGSTSDYWQSNSENNPAIYFDLTSVRDIASLAINFNKTNTTETTIKIRCSTDTTFTDGETVRYINIADFTDDTWRFIPINRLAADCRYVQIYGISNSVVLSINEVKVYYAPTTTDWNRKHYHRKISTTASDNSLDSN